MSADQVALALYVCLAAAVVLLPLRWSLIAYLLLSTIDFGQHSGDIGLLNAGKAIVLPLYLLWRLRQYSGHKKMILAPIAWILLTTYALIAAFWSFYPSFAFKLAGHMIASLVICCVFMRASKGPDLQPSVVLPVAIGVLIIAGLRSIFAPHYGEEATRFTTFSSAQSFAAFLVALYCITLCSQAFRLAVRIPLCAVLVVALVFDGSRIWAIGLLVATLLALIVSDFRPWMKICTLGLLVVTATIIIGSTDRIVNFLSEHAGSNRIAAAVTSAYEGDIASSGLGTLRFRRGLTAQVVDQLQKSSVGELLLGHGTSNGAVVTGSRIEKVDPNRFFHDEWLRVSYEWGLVGVILFLVFIGSISMFAVRGTQKENREYARPLLVFLPALLLGLTGENIIAGAGSAGSIGFLLLIALASAAYRPLRSQVFSDERFPLRDRPASRDQGFRPKNLATPAV